MNNRYGVKRGKMSEEIKDSEKSNSGSGFDSNFDSNSGSAGRRKNAGDASQKSGILHRGIIGRLGMSLKTIKTTSLVLIIVLLLACIIAPVSYLIITQSSDMIYTNNVEGSSLGARLTAAVLSMDFNQNGENYPNLPYQNRTLYEQGTYIKDGSIYNNFGTSSGLTAQYWWNGNTAGTGKINGSLQFDGSNDYVALSAMNFTNYTLSAWFNTNSLAAGNKVILSDYNTAGTIAQGEIQLTGANLRFDVFNGTNFVANFYGPAVNVGNWYQVIMVKDGNNYTMYLNGNAVNSSLNLSVPAVSGFGSWAVGRAGSYVGGYFNGSIDDVIIWGRALNATEITNIYNEGVAGRTVDMTFDYNDTRTIPADSRVGYWSFNNNESGNATDSWNGLNGTCSGTACPTWTSNNNNNGFDNTGMYTFDGVDDAIALPNSTSYKFTNENFTLSAWVLNRDIMGTYQDVMGMGSVAALNYSYGFYKRSGDNVIFASFTNGTQATFNELRSAPMVNNVWYLITVTRNGTIIKYYTNGVQTSNGTVYGDLTNIPSRVFKIGVGSWYAGYPYKGSVDEVMLFNKTLTASEITGLFQDGSKKLHLQLNELSGTTASGIGFNGTAGTLTGYPAINPTAPIYNATGGVNGSGAYLFDGVDDYLTPGSTSTLDLTSSRFTISSWIYIKGWPGGITGQWATIASRGTGYYTGAANNQFGNYNSLVFGIGANNMLYTTAAMPQNTWMHVTYVYDVNLPTEQAKIYVNGTLLQSWNITSNKYIVGGVSDLGIGSWGGHRVMNGTIDNLQIFNRALSASEVLALYNGTNANRTIKYSSKQGDFTSGVFYNSTTSTYWNVTLATADTTNRSGIVNPDNSINISHPNLVSYWALDGNYLDAKGRNNGTCTTCPNNASGLSSNAYNFNGINQRINLSMLQSPNLSVTNFTISTWFYQNTAPSVQIILGKGGDYSFDSPQYVLKTYGGYVSFVATNSSCVYGAYASGDYNTALGNSASVPISAGQWTHITLNRVGNNITFYKNGIYANSSIMFDSVLCNNANGEQLYIGGGGDDHVERYFNGSIDEVLIYNTSLSASQVSQLYKSGLSQHAITNITLQTRTANSYNISDAGLVAFWALNNVSGDVGMGGNFNNLKNISINNSIINPNTNVSYSFWLNLATGQAGTYPNIFQQLINTTHRQLIYLYNADNKLYFTEDAGTGFGGNTALSKNVWYHVVVTVTRPNTVNFYLNGILDKNTTFTSTYNLSGGNFILGNGMNGSIDEVRIYNRSLSASEVLNLYQLGSYHIANWSSWSTQQTCYDDETKIQTENGFKLFKDLNATDKVATLNPSTGLVEYNLPSAYQVYDAPEFMYKIITEKGEMIVSPDHKVYAKVEGENDKWKMINIIIGIVLILIGLLGLIVIGRGRKDGEE